MKFVVRIVFFWVALTAATTQAGDQAEAAIGGGVGGALGAAVGDELAGREGAIIGAGIGAAAGAAIATEGNDNRVDFELPPPVVEPQLEVHAHPYGSKFCPPGQAKKGRC